MNYILFDEHETWQDLLPLTYLRPLAEIRTGMLKISEKWNRYLETSCSYLCQPYLSAKYPSRIEEDNILVCGSVLPDAELSEKIASLQREEALFEGEKLVAVRLDREGTSKFRGHEAVKFQKITYDGKISRIEYPWDIFRGNGDELLKDFELLTSGRKSAELSPTNRLLGDGSLFIEEGAVVECASLNTKNGPIYIGKGAEIMEGSMIRGPFALCEGSTLKMGTKIYGPTTIGPQSKVGGEINNSVIFGFSNKAHDGFLGNSVIAEWCNLGADTNNSNLKNNYATVRVWNYRTEHFISSKNIFCGLIMGDHSKCGINTMFNTGTVVGVNANIFGSGFPRNFIPSFSWGGAHGFTTYKTQKAFEVAEEVMKRRDIELDTVEREVLEEVFRMTEKYRT